MGVRDCTTESVTYLAELVRDTAGPEAVAIDDSQLQGETLLPYFNRLHRDGVLCFLSASDVKRGVSYYS